MRGQGNVVCSLTTLASRPYVSPTAWGSRGGALQGAAPPFYAPLVESESGAYLARPAGDGRLAVAWQVQLCE